jgi:transforming growth factor-beta-induced protein
MKKKIVTLMLMVLLGLSLALESNEEETVVQGLQQDENFSTLVSLLESSGLASDLGSGNFTIFAPTNAAFEALGAEQLDALSQDPEQLSQILQGHVLDGAYTVLDLSRAEAGTLGGLSGESFIFEQSSAGLTANGVGLESTDVDNMYSNGIVHVVSGVILPGSMQTEVTPTTDSGATDTTTTDDTGTTDSTTSDDTSTDTDDTQ